MRHAHAALAGLLVAAGFFACSGGGPRHGAPPADGEAGASGASAAGAGGTGFVDAPDDGPDAACGYKVVSSRERVNLYMVVDRSGSMADSVGGKVKYDALRVALVKLSRLVGDRAYVGAAIYPSSGCKPGAEIMPLTEGDDASFAKQDQFGPTSSLLAAALNQAPTGGTPMASTLLGLAPKLKAADETTFVLLSTDGGPNCNASATCAADGCIPNLEKVQGCAQTNCCDPKLSPQFTTENCLDEVATKAIVADLAAAGVRTIVVGIPGSEAYASLLDELAVAGGAPKDGAHRYYEATDLAVLDALFSQIAQKVIVSCDIALEQKPEDPGLVNVYFDGVVVPYDAKDGWQYKDEKTIELVGGACETLQSGAVAKAEVFVGCPTKTPKG